MTKERAHEIASIHVGYDIGSISYYALQNGRNLHIQTLYILPCISAVTYIDIEDDDGDCIESEMAYNNEDIEKMIFELCEHDEEKE